MRLTRRLGRLLGWVPTLVLALLVGCALVVLTTRLVGMPTLAFLLGVAELAWLLSLVLVPWSQDRILLAGRGENAYHPRTPFAPDARPRRGVVPVVATAVSVAGVVVVLYLVRPLAILHGPLWIVVKYPVIWIPTGLTAVLVAAAARAGRRDWLWWQRWLAVGVPALLVFVPLAWLAPKLSARATYEHYRYVRIDRLPTSAAVRVVPEEVAQQVATLGFNLSGHTLGPARITRDPRTQRLTWAFEQAPNGTRNVLVRYSEGVALLDAESTTRRFRQIDRRFRVAPGMRISDNTSWRIYKDSYFSVPTASVPVVAADGAPEFVVPVLAYRGTFVKYPVVDRVYVFHPDGSSERLTAAEARRRPDVAGSGRLVPAGLARELQDAYAYKQGIFNAAVAHTDQTQIVDSSDSDNRQPYLMAFTTMADGKPLPAGESQRLYWVSSAEPRGRAFATKAIFLTDTVTAVTYVWSVPRARSLTGANQAVQDAKSLAIPGIVFASSGENSSASGRYQVLEPRPIFVAGRLQYLLSIVPTNHTSVTKSVIVDAATNKVVARFDHDSDAGADAKLAAYLRTGKATGVAPTPPGGDKGPTVAELLAENARLLRQVRLNQQRIEALLRGS